MHATLYSLLLQSKCKQNYHFCGRIKRTEWKNTAWLPGLDHSLKNIGTSFKNLRKYNFQNLKAIQRPYRGVRESWQTVAAASPNPSHPNSRHHFGGTQWQSAKHVEGWLNQTLEGEKKKLNQWLSFEEVCLVQKQRASGEERSKHLI